MSKLRSPVSGPLLIAIIILLAGCSQKTSEAPALSPDAALKSFRLSDDFRIELFVSEPQVLSPVEMVFDENGKVYVAEMLDYPEDPPTGKPARSRSRRIPGRLAEISCPAARDHAALVNRAHSAPSGAVP